MKLLPEFASLPCHECGTLTAPRISRPYIRGRGTLRQAHPGACPTCRAKFAREQALYECRSCGGVDAHTPDCTPGRMTAGYAVCR